MAADPHKNVKVLQTTPPSLTLTMGTSTNPSRTATGMVALNPTTLHASIAVRSGSVASSIKSTLASCVGGWFEDMLVGDVCRRCERGAGTCSTYVDDAQR